MEGAERFLMMRIASGRHHASTREDEEDFVDSFTSVSEDDDDCTTVVTDRRDSSKRRSGGTVGSHSTGEGVRKLISRKLGRVGSAIVLKLQPKRSALLNSDDNDSVRSLEDIGSKRGSFVKLGSMLKISRKQHDRLKEVTSAHATTQKKIKKHSIRYGLQITDVAVWTSSSNPLFEGDASQLDIPYEEDPVLESIRV